MADVLANDDSTPRVAIQVVQGCIVVPIQIDLYEATLVQLRTDVLNAIRRTGLLKIVMDLTGVALLDRFAFDHLVETRRTLALMGGTTVFAGIQAAVAACLVDLGVNLAGVEVRRSVEAALAGFKGEAARAPARGSTPPPRRASAAGPAGVDPVKRLLQQHQRGSGNRARP